MTGLFSLTTPDDHIDEIVQKIADLRAHTLAGLAVKVRAVKWGQPDWWEATERSDDSGWATRLAAEVLSAVEMLAAMQAVATADAQQA